MKPNPATAPTQPPPARRQPLLLMATAFALGTVLTGVGFYQHYAKPENGGELAAPTRNFLGQLAAPVTIRYYAVLPGSTDESLHTFAGRVAQLLDQLQTASGGKVNVTYIDSPAETNAAAASADGVQAFNLEKGAACFMGLTVNSGTKKEILARLQPEWEAALPYDIARAIQRVTAASAPAPLPREVAQPGPEIVQSVKRLIPDATAVSTLQANQIFHAEFIREIQSAGVEADAQLDAAQQQVVQAEKSGSSAAVAAARQHLLQLQSAQGEKLKQIAADLQTRLAVFEQMKSASQGAVK